jgi:hypothetical protein
VGGQRCLVPVIGGLNLYVSCLRVWVVVTCFSAFQMLDPSCLTSPSNGWAFSRVQTRISFVAGQANQKILFRWLLRIRSSRLRNGGFWTEVLKPSKRVDCRSAERFTSPRAD